MSTPTFAPIESNERLYVRVARRIAERIASGEIQPGDRLPSERELADMLQVSRPTIREAMIALEVSGVIDVRTGSGIYVADGVRRIALTDDGPGPFEILELRLLVEPEACALAAERMTQEQLGEIRAIYEQMESTDRTPDMEAVDGRFHAAIARATENAALASTIEWLWRLRAQSDLSKGFHRLILEEGTFPALEEHRAIVVALEARDPDAARDAMRRHLEASTAAAAQHFSAD
ncbi:MAG: FadR family transcriptional regulator [Pseudomonadaceae bacterium]|nr:FadR family transcriptional regulator [Pseudomonadaceae bacterium]